MRPRNFPPRGTVGWSGPPVLQPIIDQVFERYPDSRNYEPCECGVTLAIISRSMVVPYMKPDNGGHFVVEDDQLRRETSALISEHGLANANYEGDDAVLILGERV